MAQALSRTLPALATGVIGCVLATGTHLFTLTAGIAGVYLSTGRGFPQTPGLAPGIGALALDCLVAALPMIPVLALCSFAGRFAVSLGFLLVWFLGGDWLGFLFAPDFGATWAFSEPFRALYLGPMTGYAAVFTSLVVLWILAPGQGRREGREQGPV